MPENHAPPKEHEKVCICKTVAACPTHGTDPEAQDLMQDLCSCDYTDGYAKGFEAAIDAATKDLERLSNRFPHTYDHRQKYCPVHDFATFAAAEIEKLKGEE